MFEPQNIELSTESLANGRWDLLATAAQLPCWLYQDGAPVETDKKAKSGFHWVCIDKQVTWSLLCDVIKPYVTYVLSDKLLMAVRTTH